VLAWERMAEAPALSGAVGANALPHASGGRANEVGPWYVDLPSQAALTPRSLRELGFNSSWEAALTELPSVHGSFNLVDLGNGELGQVARGTELTCPWVTTMH
jgi:hypothetical protein